MFFTKQMIDRFSAAQDFQSQNANTLLYFTFKNLARDDRISLTIDHDTSDLMTIAGLSMTARAHAVDDRGEAEKVLRMLALQYPEAPDLPIKMPNPDEVRLFRVTPTVISVLDYTQGFGHTDLVTP